MTDLNPLDFEVFDGGMADPDSLNDRRTGEVVENFDITSTKKLKQRPGSEILDDTASLIDATTGVRTNGQTGSIVNYEDDLHLIVRSKDLLYAKNAATWDETTAWTKIQGPNAGWNSLPAFRALTAAGTVAPSVNWQGHEIFVGKDESQDPLAYISPQKTYLNDSNLFKVLNASLPKPADPFGFQAYTGILGQAIILANTIKTSLNVHFADTQAHVSASTAISASAATDEASLISLTTDILAKYNSHTDLETEAAQTDSTESVHGVNRITNFGFDETKITACLNYQVAASAPPTNAHECARILNQILWSSNLHYMAFISDSDNSDYFVKNTTAGFTGATDIVNHADSNIFRTGDTIHYIGGGLPGGVAAGTTYYIIKGSKAGTPAAGDYKIATTLANARAGTAINLTTDGTGKTHSDLTNLHASPTPYIYAPSWLWDYVYPEGFRLYSSTYPHISSQLQVDVGSFVNTIYNHLSNTTGAQHTTSRGVLAFFQDTQTFANDQSAGSVAFGLGTVAYKDWYVFGGMVKAYEAFKQHRLETSGDVHTVGSVEGATSASESKLGYTTKYNPSPFDKSTWEIITPLITDGKAKLVLHTAQAGRHPGGAIALTWTYNYTHVISQRRYALVYSHQYTTFKKLKFQVKSAPNYSDSYAFAHVDDPALGFTPYYYSMSVGTMLSSGSDLLKPPAMENIDADNVKLEVYRTTDGGTEFFLAKVFSRTDMGLFPVTDVVDDTTLADSEPLYTTGGVVGYDEAPRSKSLARVGDFIAYGGVVEEAPPSVQTITFSAGAAMSTITKTAHGLKTGDAVSFAPWVIPPITAITTGAVYYVLKLSDNTFSISATPGGAAISFTPTAQSVLLGSQKLQELPYRVRQSFPGIGWSSPESFYVDLESDVVTVGRAQENFVAVCKQGVYRLEGRFDEQGQGGMVAKKISDRVGGVSATCGITVGDLFYFMGLDGFYVTDGFKVNPISTHLKERHKLVVSNDLSTYSPQMNAVQCTYDRLANRIAWTISPSPANSPDALWVMHMNQTTTERAAITEWLNGVDFAPTAVGYFRGNLIRGDRQGFVFKHDESLRCDPAINRSAQTIRTQGTCIDFRYRSLPEDFGDRGSRKWVAKALFQFTNNGSLTMSLHSINDKASDAAVAMRSIRNRETDYSGIIKEKLTFPAGVAGGKFQGLRCHTKQIELRPSYAVLYASDDYAKITSSGGIATLASGFWPTPDGSIIGHDLYLESDGYEAPYPITAVSNQLLTCTGLPSVTAKKWIIKGYARNECPELLCYTIYSNAVESQPNPGSGSDGGNA